VSAQHSRSTTKTITNEGNTLKLKYEVTGKGKNISYSNEFDVPGWSKEQKEKLVKHIVDSLENSAGIQKDYLHQRIDDNGETMNINIDANRKGQVITYHKSFNVKGKTQAEKNAMVDDIMRGLGLKD
jgi:predicted GIY-YIG superfamily endonuclease